MDPSPKRGKKRILVIEDEAHIAEGLKLNLELNGHEVDMAADGITGLTKWREWSPHLIVLDIMLPGMDGLSILRHIRLMDELIPILILSAKGDPQDKVKGFSYGVDDYLAKPFNLEEFLLRVERLLIRSRPGAVGRDRGATRVSRTGFTFSATTASTSTPRRPRASADPST